MCVMICGFFYPIEYIAAVKLFFPKVTCPVGSLKSRGSSNAAAVSSNYLQFLCPPLPTSPAFIPSNVCIGTGNGTYVHRN